MRSSASLTALVIVLASLPLAAQDRPLGYYRQPSLHGNTLVFVAEGDIWKVGTDGGRASRLTTHHGGEELPAISPDGTTLAFTAAYEGPTEVYTMPLSGGRPQRWTYGADKVTFVGWRADGKLLYSTDRFSTLPNQQMVQLELDTGSNAARSSLIPLAQSADGCYGPDGTLYFTRLPFQGSHTKRYRGGTAQNIWKFEENAEEAVPLTAGYPGTSKNPMWWKDRVYFASDRDGTMNLWSMKPDGGDLRQHTKHTWDIASPALQGGRVVYQQGADIHLLDLATGKDRLIPIALESDFDQTREKWLNDPMDYLTSVHLSPKGDRVSLTARGKVFVAPHRQGRLVEVTRKQGIRYRDARFLPDGEVLAFSDESGEVELWKLPANGIGERTQLTADGDVLRWEAVPSPDGKWIAHRDKNQRLFLYNVKEKKNRQIDESRMADFNDLAWSPDSRWLAYVSVADNMLSRIKIHQVDKGDSFFLTSDRFESYSPAWSADGKWIYFLSDRNLRSLVSSPWGNYQPEPFLDKQTRIYHISLVPGLRSPFAPQTELDDQQQDEPKDKDNKVSIDREGIERRLQLVPVSPGNYSQLSVNDKGLFWRSRKTGESDSSLVGLAFARENHEVKTILDDIRRYELSADGKRLLLHKGSKIYIVDAGIALANLGNKDVNLSGWALSIIPQEEWRQMFVEAWRLERDYFYDRGLHGVDWKGVRKKYEPLVDRVSSRAELSDLVAQMVSELSALHIFVRGGDLRKGSDDVAVASLGAVLERDPGRGGYVIEHIYESDPDEPGEASPLHRPDVDARVGDVIEEINGTKTLDVPDVGMLLRRQAGKQVRMRIRSADGKARDAIVKPISLNDESDLRYHQWEYTRRLAVEKEGDSEIGYVHLRAMRGENFTEWAKGFYPVFHRQGLIIDVRNNRGGNIDSWILGRLMRKAWFHWNRRVGQPPSWNMQYAFRGHVVVLCNEYTASDGEAFTEGVRRLGIGKVIGTRTWGGEIWLTASNTLVDGGIATAAEFGVYGPEGAWLIEGHGVDPDMVVDNLPHATFKGKDAQLEAAIGYLKEKIAKEPVKIPPVPAFPRMDR